MAAVVSGCPGSSERCEGVSVDPVASSPRQSIDRPIQRSKYDRTLRRRSYRGRRERGVWVYIAAEELARAGVSVFDDPPDYRVWGGRRGGLFLRLYKRTPDGER